MLEKKSKIVNTDVDNEVLPVDSAHSILASKKVDGCGEGENSENDVEELFADMMAFEPIVAVADTADAFDIDSADDEAVRNCEATATTLLEDDFADVPNVSPSICRNDLRQKHESEFKASAIHPDLWENFITVLDNKSILGYILVGDLPRTNTGRVSSEYLRKYSSLHTGWVIETVGSDFVQIKPDKPRTFTSKGKLSSIKYESPAKYPTDIIRLRHLPHWITGGKAAEEWWESVVNSTDNLWITEGAKKTASLLSLGLPAVGLPGIFNTHTCKDGEPIPELVRIVKNKKRVYLVFDAPDKLTQHAGLENSYRKLKNLILEINPKCEVRIVCWEWWMGKGVDDAIAAGHLDKESLIKSALPYYEALMFLNTNIPAYKRITGKRYITLEDVDYFENKYTAMVVGKDGGKTTTAGAYLGSLIDSIAVLNPTHRIKLGQQLAPRLGTQYLNGRHKTTNIKNRITLCINSLNVENVNPEDYKGCVVFLDEVVQLLDFLFSGTIKKAPEVIRNFVTLITNASKIIIADADLDHKALTLLDELAPELEFLKNVKIYELKKEVEKIPMSVSKVSNRKVGAIVYESALTALLRGEKILVMVDSQRPTSKLSAETIKRALQEGYKIATGNDIKGLALYAEASKNKGHEASRIVTEGIDIVYEYDFVVYTTVIGTGVSLDRDKLENHPHFGRVIGGYSGAISINDILQGLHRYRKGVPREVYLPNKGIAAPHAGSSYSWKQNLLNTDKIKANVLSCYHSIAHEIPDSDEINRPLEKYHAKVRAFLKYECDNFFDIFCRRAQKDYQLVVNSDSAKIEVPVILEDTVKQVFSEYIEETVAAKVIDDDKRYEELNAKDVNITKDAFDLRKSKLAKKYRIEYHETLINEDLMTLDSSMNYHSGIVNHYYLDKMHYAESRGQQNIKRDALDFDKFRKDPKVKALLLIELGAKKLVDNSGEILHRNHPVVQEIISNYKRIDLKYAGLIQRHLNISLNEEDPMKIIDSLALKLAMTRKGGGRKKLPDGERVSQASYKIIDTIRYDIFPIWDENNNIDMILTQLSDIRDKDSKIRESLRTANKTEVEKEVLRSQLTELLKTEDAIKEELNQINEIRNQRKLDYEDSRIAETSISDSGTSQNGFDPTDGSCSDEMVREWWTKVEHIDGEKIAKELGLEKFVKLCEIVGRKIKSSLKSLDEAWTQYNLLEFYSV